MDLLAIEPVVRMTAFAGVLSVMALAELLAPRRRQAIGRSARWPSNLAMVAISAALIKLIFPLTAVAFALWCEARGIGIFNLLGMPLWAAVPLAIVVLDLAIYAQHVMFHHVPMLWRLHRMHHADLEFDVTTGIRFHPVESSLQSNRADYILKPIDPPSSIFSFRLMKIEYKNTRFFLWRVPAPP